MSTFISIMLSLTRINRAKESLRSKILDQLAFRAAAQSENPLDLQKLSNVLENSTKDVSGVPMVCIYI